MRAVRWQLLQAGGAVLTASPAIADPMSFIRAPQKCHASPPHMRSQGQFFQSLYQTKAKRPVGLNSEQLQVGGRA